MIFQALGGLGVFLLGLHFLSDGIRSLAAARMRSLMERLARTRFTAVLTGMFVTGVVQSSSVVTVMIVGFVNSGIVTLEQAIALIMGANIGTTITSLFIALPVAKYGLPVVGIASICFIFARADKTRHGALTVLGLGMIFFGLELMTSGFRPIRDMPQLLALFALFDAGSLPGIIKCVLFGALVTAIIQSSSAMIGIIMGMGASGVLPWDTALAIVLGAEIGTTTTSLLAASTLSQNARRTSYAHLGFNLIGVTVAIFIFPLYKLWTLWLLPGDPGQAVTAGGITSYPFAPAAVAVFITTFNIFNTLMLFPWVSLAARGLNRLGRGLADALEDLSRPRFLFNKALLEPELALSLMDREMDRYRQALPGLLDGICRPEKTDGKAVVTLTKSLASLHREIIGFGERLCQKDLPAETAATVIDRLQVQEMSDVLMQRLQRILNTWNQTELSDASRKTAAHWIEALDALVQEMAVAMGTPDRNSIEMLLKMTADQGPNLEAMRGRYVEDGARFTLHERRFLLSVLGLIEGSLWQLHRLGLSSSRISERYSPSGYTALKV